jgi:two-component system nitrogen regulation sensor histidine kinase NtrY
VNALWFMVNDNLFSDNDNTTTGFNDRKESLDRLVSNTNIDFNIFDGSGKMIYSSQPRIFDLGIVSERMNPGAYFTIFEKGITQFIHRENAGRLRFISAYSPFTDRSGKIIAFLNLPYFEKQNDLNKEVSVFLSALVNIYVLLFALAVFLTIFISSRITKPLILIQEKMSGIRLGTANEKIAYSENDEIGRLVHEYNRMIDELSVSAEMLAKSERETAWREMARQVAHEIKNPLTPMKLSVQHLSRTFKEKGSDPELLDRITTTLIQQIDTLSNIATAFSNFAKMPQPLPVKTELRELIMQISELYASDCNIEIKGEQEYFVMADRDQMNAVFSNLLKNAVQSVPSERPCRITVSLSREEGFHVVEIADNGIGILEDQRDKIFKPNFTTKSSGMGLGLAIVRNIIEQANGSIWFTSSYNTGSSFFVRLPSAD